MVNSCAVSDCKNVYKNRPDLTYHRFPSAAKDKARLEKWSAACKIDYKSIAPHTVICSEHFCGDDYERDLQHELLGLPLRKILKKTAVPSIFLGRKNWKNLDKVRERDKKRQERAQKRENQKLVQQLLTADVESSYLFLKPKPNPNKKSDDPPKNGKHCSSNSESSVELDLEDDIKVEFEDLDDCFEVLIDHSEENKLTDNLQREQNENEEVVVIETVVREKKPKRCLICFGEKNEKMESNADESNHNGMESSLKVIFLLRKVLEMPLTEVAVLMEKSNGSHPSMWIFLCSQCNKFVNEALEIHNKIQPLERQMNSCKTRIVQNIKRSSGRGVKYNEDNDDPISRDVRKFLCRAGTRRASLDTPNSNPFISGDQVAESMVPMKNTTSILLKPGKTKKELRRIDAPKINKKSEKGDDNDNSGNSLLVGDTTDSKKRLYKSRGLLGKRSHKRIKKQKLRGFTSALIRVGMEPIVQVCEICRSKLRKSQCYDHMVQHVGEYAVKCPMPSCSHTYSTVFSDNYMKHISKGTTKTCKPATDAESNLKQILRRCSTCGEEFKTNEALGTHLKLHETSETNYSCPMADCEAKFTIRQSVEYHLRVHNISGWRNRQQLLKKSLKLQPCSLCPERFGSEEMEDHLKNSHDITEVIKCSKCPYVFPNRLKLVEHVSHVVKGHSKEGISCDLCSDGIIFYRSINIRRHYYSVHQIGELVKCEFKSCNYVGFSVGDLQRHDQKRHVLGTERKLFKCDVCDDHPLGFKTKMSLISHQMKFHGALGFQCKMCPESFNSNFKLARHVDKIHLGKRFPCNICGKTYTSRKSYSSHLEYAQCPNEGDNPRTPTYVCSTCGKSFFHSNSLRKHEQVEHLNAPQEVCEICGKVFKHVSYLRMHLKIHNKQAKLVDVGSNDA